MSENTTHKRIHDALDELIRLVKEAGTGRDYLTCAYARVAIARLEEVCGDIERAAAYEMDMIRKFKEGDGLENFAR